MLGDALTEAARRGGDAPFILHGDDATSYRQLDATSRRVAAGLLRLGIENGWSRSSPRFASVPRWWP